MLSLQHLARSEHDVYYRTICYTAYTPKRNVAEGKKLLDLNKLFNRNSTFFSSYQRHSQDQQNKEA